MFKLLQETKEIMDRMIVKKNKRLILYQIEELVSLAFLVGFPGAKIRSQRKSSNRYRVVKTNQLLFMMMEV